MTAYYNEIDPFAAAWLKELIKAGHIAPGEVDTRSIEDVRADDLRGFTQCHFFAGIGVWSYALRCAGWPDDRPVWTGSCPCQPFSAAGKRGGTADERHLWPAWFHLIENCHPAAVFGEQVASKDGLAWLDLVHADLEGQGYAVGCLDLCAAGFGAPHIRQRLYFVADATPTEIQSRFSEIQTGAGTHFPDRPRDSRSDGELGDTPRRGCGECGHEAQPGSGGHLDRSSIVGNAVKPGLEGHAGDGAGSLRPPREIPEPDRPACEAELSDGRLADPDRDRLPQGGLSVRPGGSCEAEIQQQGPCNGFWSDAVWLPCRDGKARPTQPGIFPLVAGTSGGVVRGGNNGAPFNPNTTPEARVGRLRGYGNALVAPCATEFIRSYLECSHTKE